MECPKCHFDHKLQITECLRCGVIFSKYLAYAAAAGSATTAAPSQISAIEAVAPDLTIIEQPLSAEEQHALWRKAKHELVCRLIALPAALLIGWGVVNAMPTIAALLRMWTHETGHAITAWLCGYVALPTAWITIGSGGRVPVASFLFGATLAFGGYVAYRLERWFWVAASVIALVVLVAGNLRSAYQAECLITFGGDAGSFVVATALMATFYARPQSAMRRKQLRWALLVLGAIAFMDTYATWAGGFEKIVHWIDDIDERGPSDLAKLTQYYGWPIGEMQARFLKVAHLCFGAMAGMYMAGILQAVRDKAALQPIQSASQQNLSSERNARG